MSRVIELVSEDVTPGSLHEWPGSSPLSYHLVNLYPPPPHLQGWLEKSLRDEQEPLSTHIFSKNSWEVGCVYPKQRILCP